jgi:hypothetical protein
VDITHGAPPAQPKHWIGSLLDSRLLPADRYVGGALLGAVHFVAGLAVAGLGDFAGAYLTSAPMYVTAFFTGWVLAFGGYSDAALAKMPRRIRKAFALADGDDLAAGRLDDLRSRRVYTLAPGAVLAACLVWVVFAHDGFWSAWLDPTFSQQEPATALVAANVAILAMLGVSMIWGFGIYVVYTFLVSMRKTVASLPAARVYLRPVTNFGLATGLGWSIAVTALVVFFQRDLDRFAWSTIGALSVMALVLILLPQVLVHLCLERAQRNLVEAAAEELLSAAPVRTDAYVGRVTRNDDEAGDIRRLEDFIDRTSSASTWIHSPRDALALFGEILIPAIAVAVSILVA